MKKTSLKALLIDDTVTLASVKEKSEKPVSDRKLRIILRALISLSGMGCLTAVIIFSDFKKVLLLLGFTAFALFTEKVFDL